MYQKIVTTIAWVLCAIRDFVFSIWSILKKWYRPELRMRFASDIRCDGADKSNKDSMTDLMYAAYSGDLERVNQLIQDGVDLNAYCGQNKITALMYAASRGESEIVHALIKAGADVHHTSPSGHTALYYVGHTAEKHIDARNAEIVRALREAGARDENTQELVVEEETYRQAEGVTAIASGDLVSNSQASLFSRNMTDDGKCPDPEVENSEILNL